MSGSIAGTQNIGASGTITLNDNDAVVGSTYTASGAISENQGVVTIAIDGNVHALTQVLTVAAPTSGTDDYKVLTIISTPTNGGNSRVNIANNAFKLAGATFTHIDFSFGDSPALIRLQAFQGAWYELNAYATVNLPSLS